MSGMLLTRPRRLRRTPALRNLVAENALSVNDLIYPMFVIPGEQQTESIDSMPEVFRFSIDLLLEEVAQCLALGLQHFALFPVVGDSKKSLGGEEAFNPSGLAQKAVIALKAKFGDAVCIITDVAIEKNFEFIIYIPLRKYKRSGK